jgi:hypothetical protein
MSVKTTKRQAPTVAQQLAALAGMGPAALREKYLEVFGERSRTGNKAFLYKRVAWRIQSLAEGGLSERAKRRAEELARDADLRTTVPRTPAITVGAAERTVVRAAPPRAAGDHRLPIPGTVLTKTYKGKNVVVTVLADGFDYDGQTYRSLSAVAKAVTGSHWNGLLFFGLTGNKKERNG